jgi:hypothetical protein
MSTVRETLGRLRTMAPAEMASRAVTAAERRLDHLAWVLRRPSWNRQDLRGVLDSSNPALQPTLTRLEAGDWLGAHAALSRHLVTRRPRFVLTPASRRTLAPAIRQQFPRAAAEAGRRADRALVGGLTCSHTRIVVAARGHRHRGRLASRSGAPLLRAVTSLEQRSALRPECGDRKIIWEPNRHQHFWGSGGRSG